MGGGGQKPEQTVDRRLGLPTAMLLVVASMVGTGVFTTTGFLLRDIGSITAVIASWAVGGAVALFGALAYGELVAALPHNGGEYQLLSRIYHPSIGFASGFTSLVVGFSAPTAASAIAFAEYADLSLGGDALPALPLAIGLIVVTAGVHALEVGVGGRFQNAFTVGKILLVILFVVAGLFAGELGRLGAPSERPFGEALLSPAFAVGLIYVSFAYSGWNAAAYVAGEVREPKRNLPRALMFGTAIVTGLYLALNLVFVGAADVDTLVAAEERVGAVAAIGLFGEQAGRVLSGVIAVGLVSTVGALVMTGPRVYEAMGRDHAPIAALARRRVDGGPILAIGLQAAVSIVMVLTASFDALLTYIGFTLSFFAAMTVLGVFVLRHREPDLERPYRTWGHPFTSVGFIALSTWMVVFAIIERPWVAAVGLGTIATGLGTWWLLRTYSPDPMSDLPTQKRRFLGPVIGVVILLGAAAYPIYWFTLRGGTPPERIFVAVRGEPATFATTLRDAVAHELTDVGFVVMGQDDDESGERAPVPTDLDWDGALAAADDAGARYLVHVEVAVDSEREGLTEATRFAVATGSVRVGPVDAEEAEPGETRSLTFGTEGAGLDGALENMAPSFATVFRHYASGDLLTMPALVARLEDPEHVGDAERANALDDALERKAGQIRSHERYNEVCVESVVETTIDDERGPEPIQCIDVSCGEQYLFGLSLDGRQALVHIESPTAYVPFATSPAPQTAETLERIELMPLDGGEPEVLAIAENFFGYGSMARDGSRVVFVEQASRRFGVVALDVGSGARRVLSVVERPGLVVQARISPDGQWVAFHKKAFSRAHTELHVMPFDGGEASVISRRTRVGRWVFAPLNPGEAPRQLIAFDGTESYENAPRPALVDPAAPAGVVELDVGEHIVRQVAGAHEGAIVFIGSLRNDVDHCKLGTRDPSTGEITWRPLGACISDARLSPEGDLIGAAVVSREGDPEREDPEAIVMNLASGETSIHTINRSNERYVRAGGNRLVFERTIRSQFPSVHPNAVCWTTRGSDSD